MQLILGGFPVRIIYWNLEVGQGLSWYMPMINIALLYLATSVFVLYSVLVVIHVFVL